jgi:hypothetical protein
VKILIGVHSCIRILVALALPLMPSNLRKKGRLLWYFSFFPAVAAANELEVTLRIDLGEGYRDGNREHRPRLIFG